MRMSIVLPVLSLLAAPALAAPAERSWGKAGVSFDVYRADATSCLRAAAATDLTGTEPANALIRASRRIDDGLTRDMTPMMSAGPPPFNPVLEASMRVSTARVGARPDLRFHQARDILQAALDRCLQARGYRRFQLSEDQRRQLRHFHLADPARQAFLYRLASDAAVLDSQPAADDRPTVTAR